MVKNLVKSLTVRSPLKTIYSGRRTSRGFVASHIWRSMTQGPWKAHLASRDPYTNTFAANLLWLPAQVSKLTDRQGSFVQSFIQAISVKLYRNHLNEIVVAKSNRVLLFLKLASMNLFWMPYNNTC